MERDHLMVQGELAAGLQAETTWWGGGQEVEVSGVHLIVNVKFIKGLIINESINQLVNEEMKTSWLVSINFISSQYFSW